MLTAPLAPHGCSGMAADYSGDMPDPSALLSTLSQSTAVMVAIIGGFLVSRLVALSSEREGLRRQLRAARERQRLLRDDYEPAHEYRVEWSRSYFDDLALDELVESPNADIDELVADNVPRGSSVEEITPYAYELQQRVKAAYEGIKAAMRRDDGRHVDLADLKARCLTVSDADEDIYEAVLYHIVSQIPARDIYDTTLLLPPLSSPADREIEARRFDEAVNSELHMRSQLVAVDEEVQRLQNELLRIGNPVGVVSATWTLAVLSVLGIVVPVTVMATDPVELSPWLKVMLVGTFIIGIAAVLG